MKFNDPHKATDGTTFAINGDGTVVKITPYGKPAFEITGVQAKELKAWLGSQQLRSQAEAGAADRPGTGAGAAAHDVE